MTQRAINEVIVVGGGLMGSGIAQVAAQTGHRVTLVDLDQAILDKTGARMQQSLFRVAKKVFKDDQDEGAKFVEKSLANLTLTTSVEPAIQTADLVVEAIVENMKLKQKLFEQWDDLAPQKTILTSNTSTLRIKEIAKNVKRLDRIGGLHFFNPVPVMKLLEVIKIDETSEATNGALTNWGKSIGKTTVSCKDTPGFIVNRLLVPYMCEAVAMVERGDASFKDVDIAMKLGAGYPMGPFELMDYTGLDLHQDITTNEANKDFPGLKRSTLLEKLVKEGKFGRKSGEGFYKY